MIPTYFTDLSSQFRTWDSQVRKLCSEVREWDSQRYSRFRAYRFTRGFCSSLLTLRIGVIALDYLINSIPSLGKFRVSSILPESSKILFDLIAVPSIAAWVLNDAMPYEITYKIPKEKFDPKSHLVLLSIDPSSGTVTNQVSLLFYGSCAEEIVFRKLIQKTALPFIAQKTPKSVCNFLNHKWTRIIMTSVLFSLGHTTNWEKKFAFIHRFALGIILGLVSENYGTGWSAFIHSLQNIDAVSSGCSHLGVRCFY